MLAINRRLGYEAALRDAGIEPDPRLIAPADFTIRPGRIAGFDPFQHLPQRTITRLRPKRSRRMGGVEIEVEQGLGQGLHQGDEGPRPRHFDDSQVIGQDGFDRLSPLSSRAAQVHKDRI